MVEAATEFRKNSFNDSDSAILAKVATTFQNVSDEAISAGDSASFIIAQMKAFNIEAGNAEHIIDAVNAVSNNYAVSSGQLAQNLGNMSAALSVGNNTFEESLGMLTAGVEVTRNASKVSRALVSVQSRLNQVIDEASTTGQALTTWYQEHNIAIYDQQGQLRSLYDVLKDVAEIWPNLTKNEQAYYLNQQAGANQSQNLAAILSNFDTAITATETALNSAGSAMKENEAYMDSLDAKTNQLKAEFQDLANNVIDKELVGGFLDLGEIVLKFANTDLGQLITKITLLSGIGWGAESLLSVSHIFQTIGSQFKNFGTIISTAVSGSSSLATAITGIGGAAGMALPICIALGTAIVGIYEAVKAYKASHPDFETAQQSVDNLSDSLKTSKERLDEINAMDWKDRTRAINAEKEELEGLIEQEERELQVAEMRQAMAAGKELSGRTGYGEATRYTAISPRDTDNQTFISMDEAIKTLAETEGITGDSTDELKAKLLDLGYAFVTTTENTKLTADEMNALDTQTLRDLTNSIKENGELNTNLSDSYQGLYEQLAPTYEKIVNLEKAYASAIPGSRALTDSERELKGAFEELVGTMVSFDSEGESAYQVIANLANILGVTPQYAYDLAIAMGLIDANTRPAAGALVQLEDGTWGVADGLNAVKTASDGVGEAISNISVATYDTSTAAAQLTASLFDQNGQLTEAGLQALGVDSSMRSLAQSELQAQQAAAQANYANLILEIEKVGSAAMITAGQLSQMMALAGVGSAQELVGGLASGASTDMEGLKSAFFRAFGKSADANAAEFNKWVSSRISSAGQSTYDKIIEETEKRLKELQDKFPTGTGGDSSKSAEEKAAEEAEKQAKKAQQAQEKAAKESQQAYESAAKSAEQAAQEAARAAEQAAEQAKQKILDTISELKDASDDFWTSKTDAVEETNTELDRQKQLEEKLKALEEAKQKKILLYKNGQFQYDKDYGSIAKAQADYEETRDKIHREKELEQLKEMKDNATEIFNEMKDIINNGGNVTQDMIDKWLKNMAALGVDYYDSNKTILNEWLDWAKGAIKEFSQDALAAIGSYTSTSSYMSNGTYGNSASANGESYMDNPMYYDEKGEFVGFDVAFWIDRFEKQLKSGFKPEEWLGGGKGTNVFEDWEEVMKYWAEFQGDAMQGMIADAAALEEMYTRAKAAKIVLSQYKDMFTSLGYDEYAKIAERIEQLDLNKAYASAKIAGAIAHPDDPFGMRVISPADYTTIEGKLYDILIDISRYEGLTGSRIASRPGESGADYKKMTIAGDLYRTAILGNYHQAGEKLFTDAWGDYFPGVEDVQFNLDKLKTFYQDNEDAIKKLQDMWYEAKTEAERQAIHLEAEARRQARDYAEELLGMSPSGRTEAEREANRTAGSLYDSRKNRVMQNNIENIKDSIKDVNNGQTISSKYIQDAKDYIAKTIEENSQKWFDTYDQSTKDSLHAQNEQLRLLQEQLEQAEKMAADTGNLVESDGLLDKEIGRLQEDYDPTEEIKALQEQMRKNSEAWWTAATKEEKDALHQENIRLAKMIEELTQNKISMKYEGSTGRWSWEGKGNAHGTHNFSGGLSLVGENGPEMRILGKGDNIIPHSQTENLWKWSSTTPQAVLSTLSARQGGGNTSYAFDVSRIELPNVTDAKSFVNGLKNYALQYSYKR